MKDSKIGTEQLAALGLTLVAASLTVGLLTIGCGKQEAKTAATEAVTTQETPTGNTAAAASAPAPAAPVEEGTPAGEEQAAQETALPPDIAGSVSEEFVAPGDVVEITAEGTTDVVEVTLTDGRGKTQPLTFDSSLGMWKTLYRVPLRTATDRLGLSLTAKNGSNGWRRVWVFVNVQKLEAGADSTGQ
jgi:hypothetical protein